MVGYGRSGYDPRWPDGASIAVQFVINYEEGGENSILDGDTASEARLSEIACHGLRWLSYKDVPEEVERAHLEEAVRLHTGLTGTRPLGWYTGAQSERTTDLVMEEGGFLYSSDSYADELPYWIDGRNGPHLMIPYAFDTNDVKFVTPQGFNSGDQFFTYLKDSFDALYAEGEAGQPKMMSIGLHCRITGRPGRARALQRFLDYVKSHERVWLARRIDIARHWHDFHKAGGPAF